MPQTILDNLVLSTISELHLKAIKDLKIAEDDRLDYKETLELKTDSQKREFCKDLSSLANTLGGHIIIGISEEDGKPKEIVGFDYNDKIANQVLQVITSGINPRLQYVESREVSLENGKIALIVKISSDGYLHQVKYDDDRYYRRVGRITVRMESADIETFYKDKLQGKPGKKDNTTDDKLLKKNEAYLNELKTGKYFRGCRKSGLIAVSIFPELETSFIDMSNVSDNIIIKTQPIYSTGWDHQRSGRSFYSFATFPDEKLPHAVTELTENGTMKAYNASLLSPDKHIFINIPEEKKLYVPSVAYEMEIIKAIYRYLVLLKSMGISGPWKVFVSLIGIKGYYMYIDTFNYGEIPTRITKDDINPDPVIIDQNMIGSDIRGFASHFQKLFDFIWREFGLSRSFNYNANSEWAVVY